MTISAFVASVLVIVTILLTVVEAFEAPTNSCAIAIHKFLSDSSPVFDTNKKSLSLEIGIYTYFNFFYYFIKVIYF